MTAVLAVSQNGTYVDLPTPAYGGYTTSQNELVQSERNTLGNLYKYRINVKATVDVTWVGLTSAQKNLILSLTSGNEFNLRYFDVFDSTVKFGRFYRGSDASVEPFLRYDGTDFPRFNVTLSLVEF